MKWNIQKNKYLKCNLRGGIREKDVLSNFNPFFLENKLSKNSKKMKSY